jgi:hypothetical protein
MMGRRPNIDRIAKEGMLSTDHYGQAIVKANDYFNSLEAQS